MHLSALWAPCVGLQNGLPVGHFSHWTFCCLTYPLKPSHAGAAWPHPIYEKLMVGPVLGSKSTKCFSDQMVLRVCCHFIILPPSMKRDVFQLFIIKSFMSLSSTAFVSSVAVSWLFIVFLFLDFHMAHIVIEIRMRSLSESLLRLFSKESAVQWNRSWLKVQGRSDAVQHNAKVRMESGGLPVNNTCLRAGRSYYSSGLGCALTTISTLGRKWGDG
jgi:hypothetical protein